MIVVTGTMRSGTSLWMQILDAAGFPVFGEAFPNDWGETLREANEDGFFESHLREGINWATNPHPKTGVYLRPEQVERHAVKVFVPGLVRSDLAFLGRVVATVRRPRDVVASVERLFELEDAARRTRPRRTPALQWWAECYALVRDVARRGYPAHLVSFDALFRDPERTVYEIVTWLGGGDVEAGARCVRPERRHFAGSAGVLVDPDVDPAFDELYDVVDSARPLSRELVEKLDETHRELLPRMAEDEKRLAETLAST